MSEAPSDRLREVYDRRAELEYAEPAAAPDPRVDRKFERLLELVSERLPCEAFLDAGCGDGRYLAALGALPGRPAHIVGVDISERILATARAAAERAGIGPELVRANVEALPFGEARFDLVLCAQVVEHLLDPAAGLAELARVLRPGGTLVVSTDHRRNLVSKALNAPRSAIVRALGLRGARRLVEFPHATFVVEELVALVGSAGLVPEQVATFRFSLDWPLGRPALLRLLNRIEKALPPHRLGDILAVVARKPVV